MHLVSILIVHVKVISKGETKLIWCESNHIFVYTHHICICIYLYIYIYIYIYIFLCRDIFSTMYIYFL